MEDRGHRYKPAVVRELRPGDVTGSRATAVTGTAPRV